MSRWLISIRLLLRRFTAAEHTASELAIENAALRARVEWLRAALATIHREAHRNASLHSIAVGTKWALDKDADDGTKLPRRIA